MQDRFIKSTINEMKEFVEDAKRKNMHMYSTTLTYRDSKYNKRTKEKRYFKLPKQKIAINRDMKKFRDGIRKAFNRMDIKFECFFIYVPYGRSSKKFRPHFHGEVAISEAKKVDAYIKKYWKNGFIFVTKNHDPNRNTEQNVERWIEYIANCNVLKNKNKYISNCQIKSRTRKTINILD